MKVDTVSVSVVSADGPVRELDDGRVLVRPGQVYKLRLTNHRHRRAVARITIDGREISEGGLVLPPSQTVTLERPLADDERGRFTVFREGHEVLGEDGGRDNPDLGLIEVSVRYEAHPTARLLGDQVWPYRRTGPLHGPLHDTDWRKGPDLSDVSIGAVQHTSLRASSTVRERDVEGAAGTGLTGESDQAFRTVRIGELEDEEIIVRLRLVIGRKTAIEEPRPLPGKRRENPTPPRPEARP